MVLAGSGSGGGRKSGGTGVEGIAVVPTGLQRRHRCYAADVLLMADTLHLLHLFYSGASGVTRWEVTQVLVTLN